MKPKWIDSKEVHERFNELGWELISTGGNCEAYSLTKDEGEAGTVNNKKYWLVTVAEEASVPTNGSDICYVGYYDTTLQESESIVYFFTAARTILDGLIEF